MLNEDTRTEGKERREKLRKIEDYQKDLEHGPQKSGLKDTSVFNDVDNFHIYENDYFDILHDISEGALEFALEEILYHFIIKIKRLDIDIFNDRLKTFNYTANGFSNKPPPISFGNVNIKKFSLSGSETTTLFLILPFLIGDLIDLNSDVWQFYLVLREILDLVMAKDIEMKSTFLLDSLVEEHHKMFVTLFRRLRPKQHNMIHYGSCTRKRGPLSNINTVRYEANHAFFKTAAKSTYSREEITYTLCLKDQYSFHYNTKFGNGLKSRIESGPQSSVPTFVTGKYSFMDEHTFQCNWVQVRGFKYSIGTCLLLSLDEKQFPIFGKVDNIFAGQRELISLSCKLLDIENYDRDMNAFVVHWTGKNEIIENI
ncbi:hypothetical protein QAD02_002873 [Eretmocerus hayati]|uniref:Uncharacterized protein n=1 Tax=Eretmocerus hayati TaxID=131215 RepID=A0ACC2NMS5_9HYME|nr:hypothetical protein QAD02_002873 [Eretmocerus hayati]